MSTTDSKTMDESNKGDMMVNNLIYRQPKALSLARNRTMRRQYFQRSTYSAGEEAVIVLNTGSDYVKACNSYLTFNMVTVGAGSDANFGTGSAVNVVQDITVRTRSGTELDRTTKLNLWSAKDTRHNYSQDWIDHYGTMSGLGSTGIGATDAANVSTVATRFVVPLSMLSGFFRPIGGQLIPPQLAAGMEIRLNLADFRTALFQKTATITGYTLSDISIVCDCVSLADDTQKSLNFESASSGLEYTYPRVHTATSTVTSTDIQVQVQKSVAQANVMTACLVTQGDVLSLTADSFKSQAWNFSEWQYRVGSLYYPNEALKDSAQDAVESFFIAQQVYDKPKHSHAQNAVSLADFKTNGFGVLSASFERDQSLNLSGTPLNNSRQAQLTATLASWTANIELTLFVEYTAVVRGYLDNAVVSI